MIEHYIRKQYQSILVDPLLTRLHDISPPLLVTMLSCLTGILVVPALYFHMNILAVALLLLSGYFDTLDGTIARYRNDATPLGSVYDIMSDRIVEFAVIFGLWSIETVSSSLL